MKADLSGWEIGSSEYYSGVCIGSGKFGYLVGFPDLKLGAYIWSCALGLLLGIVIPEGAEGSAHVLLFFISFLFPDYNLALPPWTTREFYPVFIFILIYLSV